MCGCGLPTMRLETVAELALQRKVGARGLRMILEDLMLELMYHLPMQQRKVREFRGDRGNGPQPRNQLELAREGGIALRRRPQACCGVKPGLKRRL